MNELKIASPTEIANWFGGRNDLQNQNILIKFKKI